MLPLVTVETSQFHLLSRFLANKRRKLVLTCSRQLSVARLNTPVTCLSSAALLKCVLGGTVMRGLKVFGLCIGAASICAFVFVVMLHFSLPPSDGAYGLSIAELLSDPFVFFGALYGGAICGVLSFPFAYLGPLHRRLFTSALFVFGVVITEIVLVTPFAGWGGLVGSIPALGFGLLICQFSGWKWFA